ncbi:MAG TPA: hypothetical protein DD624_02260 [Alphaproteobacteria bacterium]|nr:hypothetical protein [Alphaproteobacteria bacterium]
MCGISAPVKIIIFISAHLIKTARYFADSSRKAVLDSFIVFPLKKTNGRQTFSLSSRGFICKHIPVFESK